MKGTWTGGGRRQLGDGESKRMGMGVRVVGCDVSGRKADGRYKRTPNLQTQHTHKRKRFLESDSFHDETQPAEYGTHQVVIL